MKIKKSELKRIIAEELEESVIEEGLWDTVVGGMVQGGHGDASRAMGFVNAAIKILEGLFANPTANSTLFGIVADTGRWMNTADSILRQAKQDDTRLTVPERHLKIMSDLRYKYPTNKKIAAALVALETLDKTLYGLIDAARKENHRGVNIDMEQKKAALAKFYAEEAEERTRKQIARGDVRKAKEQAEAARAASIRKILGILGSQMASTATNRLNEDQNLQNIIEEELQAVLAEMKD